MVNLEDLKMEARRLLKDGTVDTIIGYAKKANSTLAVPTTIRKADEVDRLIWDPTCVHNLVRYLVEEKRKRQTAPVKGKKKTGIFLKGCDSRALVVLLQEEFLNRDEVYILGISCENNGVIDPKKLQKKTSGKKIDNLSFENDGKAIIETEGKKTKTTVQELLADRCLECQANFPVIKDIFFGEEIKKNIKSPFASIEKIESMSAEERWSFWKNQLDKCIRCYACRSVCPMCYCEECVVDTIQFAVNAETTAEEKAQKIKWIEKSPVTSENFVYHMVRAMHLAGRCIDCGECERVCPVEIPIRLINKKMEKEAKELFNYESGFDPEQPSLVSSYRDEDPEDFIR